MPQSPGGPAGKEDAETRHACGWRYLQSRGEKKCSDCQRIVADRQLSTLRSNTQRRIQILRVRQAPVLLHVAGRPKPVMGDAEVKDQAPAPGLIPKIVPNLHIAAPLTFAGRHAMLSAYRVSGRAEQRPQYGHHPVSRAPWLHLSELCTCSCGRRESPCRWDP